MPFRRHLGTIVGLLGISLGQYWAMLGQSWESRAAFFGQFKLLAAATEEKETEAAQGQQANVDG